MDKKGTLVVISAPSGGGKTTVIKKIMDALPYTGKIVTSTSREPRAQEKDGVDYHFLSKAEFEKRIANNEFVEHALYADHYYGVEKSALEEGLAKHRIAFITPDVQGKKHYNEMGIPHTSIFLMPEDMELLKRNIAQRGGMDEETLKKRMKAAEEEVSEAHLYDYMIVNREGQLDKVAIQIMKILAKIG